jgi:hypothetical protein
MRTSLRIAALSLGCLGLLAGTASAATHTMDIVTFQAPAGWKIEETPGHFQMTYTEEGSFCLIGIYKSTDARPDMPTNFASEWKHIVEATFDKPIPPVTPKKVKVGNVDALWGAANVKKGDKDFWAQLYVLDAGAKVTSIMMLTYNEESFDAYRRSIEPMLAKMEVKKTERPTGPGTAPAAPEPPPVKKLEVPPPPKKLTLPEIAGEWKEEDSILTEYDKAKIRTVADYQAVQSKAKFTIDAKGNVTFETITKEGAPPQVMKAKATLGADKVLTFKAKGAQPQIFVVRGLLADPSLNVLKLNGPWPGDIPMDIKTDPTKGPTLDHYWVRAPQ